MSRGYPSMAALLGLIAVAGFQNRDKIIDLLSGGNKDAEPSPTGPATTGASSGGLGGLLGGLGGALAGAGASGALSSGLGELLERFKETGQGDAAQSWVNQGPNQEIAPQQLEQAIGPDVLASLSKTTGLSAQELLARLSRDLPQAVDAYTPEGRI